jgi:hypothetical protein
MQRGQDIDTIELAHQTADSMTFESAFRAYVTDVESFVSSMHRGLQNLESLRTQPQAEASDQSRPEHLEGVTADVVLTASPVKAQNEARRWAGKRVLVVESIEKNRVLFGRYFQEYPLAITFVKSETEAESALAEHSYDLIVRDWNDRLSSGAHKGTLIEEILSRIPS